jgi:Flp pilus assembly protein TadG
LLWYKFKNNNGQTIVETALSIIILFLVIFGITEFGRAMYIKNMLNNASRAAARAAVVTPDLNPSNTTTTYDYGSFSSRSDTDTIQQKVFDSLFYVKKADIKATVESTHSPAQSGDTVTVQVTLQNFTSFVPKLIKIGNTLVGTASMRYE